MGHLRKIAGVSVLFIIVFMVIALMRFRPDERLYPMQDQIEYFFDYDWTVAVADGSGISETDLADGDYLQTLAEETVAGGNSQIVDLPYEGSCGAGDLVMFGNIMMENYRGLTLGFPSRNAGVWVILDHELLYEYYPDGDGAADDGSGEHMNYVELPYDVTEGELWIVMSSSEPDQAAALDSAKVETRDKVVVSVVGSNVMDIGCCLLDRKSVV